MSSSDNLRERFRNAARPLPDFNSLKKVHVIGVCGTLMGAFAAFLKRQGIDVTGSDLNVYPPMSEVLENAGVKLLSGYRRENLLDQSSRPDLVVIGNVITPENPEAQAALEHGYAFSSLPEAMERLLLLKTRNIVVSGTHGKTTTSSMMAHVLARAGQNPNYFIGGVSQDLPSSFHVPALEAGHPFVLEGDEYDTAFWDKVPKFNHYLPDEVILTSVEFDHADIYSDLDAVMRAFQGLLSRIRPGGHIAACVDYENVRELLRNYRGAVDTYGSDGTQGARFTPKDVVINGDQTKFTVFDQQSGAPVDEINIQMPGHHNVLNALAVWIKAVHRLGVSSEQVRQGLSSFRGVKRRQEVRGEPRGILVLDDFAHHPTAVRETLKALRAKYRGRRLVAVFEPRSATSRRRVFQDQYAQAFGGADAVFISRPYNQSSIDSSEQFSSDELVGSLVSFGVQAQVMPTVDEGVKEVAKFAQRGDVVAVLSNGGFEGFIPKLLQQLSQVGEP